MTPEEFGRRAAEFRRRLEKARAQAAPQGFGWYPYNTLHQHPLLQKLLESSPVPLDRLLRSERVADIGCADADLAFFLESLGCEVDAIDHAATNFNGLRGASLLKQRLGSSVGIHAMDLDNRFRLPAEHYGLAVFLGILYHLKNPYYALETLAEQSRWCILSTRVARFTPDRSVSLQSLPVAYLLDERETNDDSTNYWIFSEAGMRRLLARTGWNICVAMPSGSAESDPVRQDADERMFYLLESRSSAVSGAGVTLGAGWHAPEQGGWRWTERRFVVTVSAPSASGPVHIRLGVTVPEVLTSRLGAITLRGMVDGVPLAPEVFRAAGSYVYSRELPRLRRGRPATLAFELDKALEPGFDSRELGIIVSYVSVD